MSNSISWLEADQTNLRSLSLPIHVNGKADFKLISKTDTSYTFTGYNDGDKIHWEVIGQYDLGGPDYTYKTISSGDLIYNTPDAPTGLTVSFIIPGKITVAGLQDINPGVGGGQSNIAGIANGDFIVPKTQQSTIFLGSFKFNGIDKNAYLKVLIQEPLTYTFEILQSDNGGVTGAPAFLPTASVVLDPLTGLTPAAINDNSSGFAMGGTIVLQIPP